jgi:hypothetical protein
MPTRPNDLRKTLFRLAALIFIGFLIAVVVIADRGEGGNWWPFIGQIPLGDKLGHVGLIGTLGFLCNLAFTDRRATSLPRFITRTTWVLLAVVSLEEIAQAFIPTRSFDPIDWLADMIGLAVGQTLALTILKFSSKEPHPRERN